MRDLSKGLFAFATMTAAAVLPAVAGGDEECIKEKFAEIMSVESSDVLGSLSGNDGSTIEYEGRTIHLDTLTVLQEDGGTAVLSQVFTDGNYTSYVEVSDGDEGIRAFDGDQVFVTSGVSEEESDVALQLSGELKYGVGLCFVF